MRLHRGFLILAAFSATLFLFSCRSKEDPITPAQGNGNMKIEFTNVVGNEAMTLYDGINLTNKWYRNAAGDSFQISVYKYYVSNVQLHSADGKTYTEPESYHLISQDDANSRKFVLSDVPAGNYTSISYMIGVDSARNVSGAQTGALDPGLGMIWDWRTGYIMAKMEGMSPTSMAVDKKLTFHIAGFSGEFNVLKSVTLPFPEAAKVSQSNTPNAHILSDALEWFKNPEVVSFSTSYYIMNTGKNARTIANNYEHMFKVDHIDN